MGVKPKPLDANGNLEPPDELDGAEVILWAYNPQKPFFVMKFTDGSDYMPIHGLALCRYKGKSQVYRFSCSLGWQVQNDSVYDSEEEAIKATGSIFQEQIKWNKKKRGSRSR
jgi:hypothetical protein